MRTALACTLAAGAVIAGCGASSAGTPLAAQDSATLRNDVGAIRAAAAANAPTAAHAAAGRLRADVQRLLGQGRLSAADAQSILTAAGHVDSRISAEVHAPPARVTSPSTAAPAPAPAAPAPAAAAPPAAHGPGAAKPKAHAHGPGPGGKDGGD